MTTKRGLSRTVSFLTLKIFIYAQFGFVLGLTIYIFYDGASVVLNFLKTDILPYYYSLTKI
jgi:hypothetical protein